MVIALYVQSNKPLKIIGQFEIIVALSKFAKYTWIFFLFAFRNNNDIKIWSHEWQPYMRLSLRAAGAARHGRARLPGTVPAPVQASTYAAARWLFSAGDKIWILSNTVLDWFLNNFHGY